MITHIAHIKMKECGNIHHMKTTDACPADSVYMLEVSDACPADSVYMLEVSEACPADSGIQNPLDMHH
jgi:NAD-dependent dihydropyrimidine dehydrogenase PreA subunit